MNHMSMYIWILSFSTSVLTTNLKLEYGPTTVTVDRFETCKGPKRRECAVVKLDLNRGIFITHDLVIKSNVKLTTGRVVATSNGKEVMKFHMKSPCDHLLVSTLFRVYLNLTSDCILRKGHYVFKANIQEISMNYFDGKYFYGNWTIRSIYTGSECNVLCTIMQVVMTPREIESVLKY